MNPMDIILGLAGLAAGSLVGLFVIKQGKFNEKELHAKAEKRITDATAEGSILVSKAREHVAEIKKEFEFEEKHMKEQVQRMEKVAEAKQASLQKRESKNIEISGVLEEEEKVTTMLRAQAAELEKHLGEKLVAMTGMSRDEAKAGLIASFESSIQAESELRLQREIEWAQESAVRDARNVLAESMYRYGATAVEEGEHHAIVKVPRDEIKGRIIGRGGHVIAFFEELFGVDVIFNDEPNTILVGCFNLVQRGIACCALERLMRERNITEEVITRIKPLAEEDMDKVLRREGESALRILGLKNMPPDFAILVGRLKFRTSYGQNILRHCFEVGYFSRLIASEIGADPHVAWLGGFFHDIGKAIDQEVGGSHDVLSKEILEKYNFSWEITHAAWTHHNAIPQETIEARIVQAADAISASRPGARAESVDRYLAKIRELQETALSFPGVKKAFAINAGREVRVVVEADRVNDAGVHQLANDIAAKVQEKGGYPGKIKVMTIRVTKATDYAR